MKSMIFAAGLGTRLKPLTNTLPKALVPVCGRPLIEHVLRKIMDAGISGAVVNVHHFADKIEDWLEARPWISVDGGRLQAPSDSNGDGRMSVRISDERNMLLETGGAVLHARQYLEGCGSFLVHNVDILSNCDIEWLAGQVRDDAVATLLVSERKTRRYLLFEPDSMRLAGWTDVSAGEYRMADGSADPLKCRMLAFSGIHILSDRIFGIMEEYLREKGIEQSEYGARFPITDFYLSVASRYPVYGVLQNGLELLDVGKLDALGPAEEFVERQ